MTSEIKTFTSKNQFDLNDFDQMTTMLLLICALSNQFKAIAETMLDTYYPEVKKKEK